MKHLSTLAYGAVDDIVLLAHFTPQSAQEEWNEMIRFCNERSQEDYGVFFVLGGPASINANQRQDVTQMYKKYKMELVVLTSNRLARGALTAMQWFGVPSRGFGPEDVEGAIKHLKREHLLERVIEALAPCQERNRASGNQ